MEGFTEKIYCYDKGTTPSQPLFWQIINLVITS